MDPLISAEQLLALLGTADVVLLDARGGPDARQRFEAGTIPGAIFVDLETELSGKVADPSQGGRHPLPEVAAFAALLQKWHVTPTTTVVVFDDKGGANAAARLWWMLRAIGHLRVAVVDGGYAALAPLKGSIPVRSRSPAALAEPYPATPWNWPTVDLSQVESAARNPDRIIVDVREAYRYRGDSEPIDLVAGHIPGAVNRPFVENLDTDGRFLSADQLREKYRDLWAGRSPSDLVVHCGSGVTACHTLLAFELAGFPGAALYVGSWSEWSRNQRPIAVGESRTGLS